MTLQAQPLSEAVHFDGRQIPALIIFIVLCFAVAATG
jgi:hypothetical protein